MNTPNITTKSDILGIIASTLCFIHCVATPFLFVAYSSTTNLEAHHPWWWGSLDIIFLAISFLAVYWSSKNTSKQAVRYAFWGLWGALAFIIVNEKWELLHLAEEMIYLPTIGLVLLHIYNRRYCQCGDEHCCAEK